LCASRYRTPCSTSVKYCMLSVCNASCMSPNNAVIYSRSRGHRCVTCTEVKIGERGVSAPDDPRSEVEERPRATFAWVSHVSPFPLSFGVDAWAGTGARHVVTGGKSVRCLCRDPLCPPPSLAILRPSETICRLDVIG